MTEHTPLKINTLKSKYDVDSLPYFIISRGTFDASGTSFIENFDTFTICITQRLPVPDASCSKECTISWNDMTGKTEQYFAGKLMDLNEDKTSPYTLSFILNDKSWEKLYLIIGTTLMDFILTKSILLRFSRTDGIYFVVNRDADRFCSELNISDKKANPNRAAPVNAGPKSQPRNSNGPSSFNSIKSSVKNGGETLPVHQYHNTDYLSFTGALYSMSHGPFWPRMHPIVSKTVDEILESILGQLDCRNPEYAKVQADKSKLNDLKTVITDIVTLHRTRLDAKIIRKFRILGEKKSATKIRQEKRRRQSKRLKPFPTRRVGRKFLKGRLKFVKPVSKEKVLKVLSQLIRKLFYALLCGSKANFSLLKKRFSKFLNLGKGQSVSVEFFTNGIQLRNIKWLQGLSSVSTKKFLFCKVFRWFFENYILTFLKTFFFITETGKSRNSVLFFDKISWISMKNVYMMHFSRSRKFRRISQEEAENLSKSIGYFRFIPKSKGVRPLGILRRNDDEKEINQYKIVLQQLLYNLSRTPPGSESLLESLNKYYAKLKSDKENLFFVKVDVHDAFGSILQDKLINIIEEGLASLELSDKLSLHHFQTFLHNRAQDKFYLARKVRYSINLSRTKAPRNSINIFSKKETIIDVSAMMSFLKRFIKSQVFKEGTRFFHQVRGVPQSNPLSPVFSELYYYDLTTQHLIRFITGRNLLFRYFDDFIFITPNQTEAKDFHNTMSSGFPDYNCFFANDKLETNLPESINPVSELHFFGYSIDVCSSAVMVDYSSFNKTNTFSSISLLQDRNVSKVVEYHFRNLQICANSFYNLSLKYRFNSMETMALNFFEAALMVARKLRILISTLFHDCSNTRYLCQVVLSIVSKFEDHNEELRKLGKDTLPQSFVKAITIDGFLSCFANNPIWYEVFLELECIRQQVHSSLSHKYQQKLRRIFKHSVSLNELDSTLKSTDEY